MIENGACVFDEISGTFFPVLYTPVKIATVTFNPFVVLAFSMRNQLAKACTRKIMIHRLDSGLRMAFSSEVTDIIHTR